LILTDEHKPADFSEKRKYIRKVVSTVKVPEFVPKKVKITTDERVTKEPERDVTTEVRKKFKNFLLIYQTMCFDIEINIL
jgi:hypothetical protein